MQKNVIKDRLVISPMNHVWNPEDLEGGSFYNHLCNAVRRNIEDSGDWIWLENRLNGDQMNASQFEHLSKKFAVIFKDFNIGKNDVMHLVVGNHNYTYAALGGMWILGGIGSLGDVALDAKAIAGQLRDTNAKIVICTQETVDNVRRAIDACERKIHLFSFGPLQAPHDDVEDIIEGLQHVDEREAPDPVAVKNTKTETCIIFWSSGTTGLPKGICHSHFGAFHFPGFGKSMVTPNSPAVTTTCFFHVGGFFTGMLALEKRQTYHHMFGADFTLDILLNTIIEVRPATVALGAHHYVQLAESNILANANPADLDSVNMLFPAGSAVPSSCEDLMKQKFRNLKGVLNGYGQTESGIVCAGFANGNLGMMFPHYKVKIEDPETGLRCKTGEIGEICIKGPFRMLKYLKRPKETDEYFDFEGFGHSGDLGYYDKEGNLIYVDRIKELIKYKNNHVSPTELEDILQKHPSVQESLVFGKKDPHVQEIICAVVVKKPGAAEVEAKELVEFVNSKVIDYKKIRGGVIFRDQLPRNNVGKLVRRHMREWAQKEFVTNEE